LSSPGLLQRSAAVRSCVAGHAQDAQHEARIPSPSSLPSGAGCKDRTKPKLFRQGSDARSQPLRYSEERGSGFENHPSERVMCPSVAAAHTENCKPLCVIEISQSPAMAAQGLCGAAAVKPQPFHLSIPDSFLPLLSSFYLLLHPHVYFSPFPTAAPVLALAVSTLLFPHVPPLCRHRTHHHMGGQSPPPRLQAARAAHHQHMLLHEVLRGEIFFRLLLFFPLQGGPFKARMLWASPPAADMPRRKHARATMRRGTGCAHGPAHRAPPLVWHLTPCFDKGLWILRVPKAL